MKPFFILFLSTFFIFFTEKAFASEPGALTESTEKTLEEQPFRILSWNIYMLPRMILRVREAPIRRARAMGDVLAEEKYDVLVLQEAFDRRVRRIMRRKLRDIYPYEYGPANLCFFSFNTNSGIWILSRHPMRYIDEIQYEKAKGWDAWSRKGALMVEVDFNGQPVHIIGTHLQSGGRGRSGDTIRYSQNRQIREELLDLYAKPEIPILICGDFNVRKRDTLWYEKMLEVLDAEDGPFLSDQQYTSDHPKNQLKTGTGRSVIDYIFIRDEQKRIERFERYIRIIRRDWSEEFSELSDHFAVEGKLWLRKE